jgi:hypothetical protein
MYYEPRELATDDYACVMARIGCIAVDLRRFRSLADLKSRLFSAEQYVKKAFESALPAAITKRRWRPFTTFSVSASLRKNRPTYFDDVLSEGRAVYPGLAGCDARRYLRYNAEIGIDAGRRWTSARSRRDLRLL